MIDPQTILNDLDRGKKYYSGIVHDEIYINQIGIKKDNYEIKSKCLLYIIKSLDFRTDNNKYDTTTEKLWRCLIKIIGTYNPPVKVRFYYGQRNTNDILSLTEILESDFIELESGNDPIIPYIVGSIPTYNWMAELSTEPIKTKWQDTVNILNNGYIAKDPDDLFKFSTPVDPFRIYITDFKTQFPYPIQFKKI